MKSLFLIIAIFCSFIFNSYSQNAPFSVSLESVDVPGLVGLQSFAFGQHEGKWLIIGGRVDGLHRRQPFAAFDVAGHNTNIYVVDPFTKETWSTSINSLPANLKEPLSATNMEFSQQGDQLYIIGGYGYSPTQGDHTTFGSLIAVHVPATIAAIQNNTSFASHLRQVNDVAFEVTGGHLEKIYDTFYLVGGQKFVGRYNPMGPTHGPGFFQAYTDQIRKFNIIDNGVELSVVHLPSITDAATLHRRDYNVVPQIFSNGQEGLTAFSGVFQPTIDLPFLSAVNIDSAHHAEHPSFSQYYNHYHCPVVPLYSEGNNEMHTLFFGGIAQYYDSLGILVQDNNVPFTRTIARVSRSVGGQMAEFKLPEEMPLLLGAGAEFIPIETLPTFPNGVIKLDALPQTPILLGYIYGGIQSDEKNIFFINEGNLSSASHRVFKVFLTKNDVSSADVLNMQSLSTLKLMVFPNPSDGLFRIKFNLEKASRVQIIVRTMDGKVIDTQVYSQLPPGEHTFNRGDSVLPTQGNYLVQVITETEQSTQKVIISLD